MYRSAETTLKQLREGGLRGLLMSSRKGIEKESLRVSRSGTVSLRPHPAALGSALTHPWITTDYSEALLEFITPPETRLRDALAFLEDIHRYVYHVIDDELLWTASMPCVVGPDSSIPIADYGSSNVGRMKHVYRHGLAWRYGRRMQAIAGVHFNYSFSQELLDALQDHRRDEREPSAFRSHAYFGLIRNIQRYGWLIPVLFGASPALCRSFLAGQPDTFQAFDANTLYEPYATSLRMSDVGYKNKAQAALAVSYNDLDSYVRSLGAAIRTADPDYAAIGTRVDGVWRQLNTNILQIENEYYSFVRPKAVAHSGEAPSCALKRAGVEYVEVRALDLDPYAPTGVSDRALRFIEILLLFCLLQDSPDIAPHELRRINHNQGLVARMGRQPGLQLRRGDGSQVELRHWALELLAAMAGPAELLDEGRAGTPYADALGDCLERIRDPECTPSGRILADLRSNRESFIEFALRMSEQHKQHFLASGLPDGLKSEFAELARRSLAEQAELETDRTVPFEAFLDAYFQRAMC